MKRSLGLWKRPYAGVNHLVLALAMLLSRHLRRIKSLPPHEITVGIDRQPLI